MPDFVLRLFATVSLILVAACTAPSGPATDPGGGGSGVGGGGSGSGGGGGSGDGGDPPPPPSDLFIMSEAERLTYDTTFRPAVVAMRTDAVQGGQYMLFADLPAGGTYTYAGYMELMVALGTAGANVAGPATLTLVLSDLSLTGSATGFQGVALDENLVEQAVNYAGTILISNGHVTSGGANNAGVRLDVDGTLDSGLHLFGIDGTLVGSLYGTDGAGLRVRGTNTSIDGSMVTTVDGAPGQIGSGMISALRQSAAP